MLYVVTSNAFADKKGTREKAVRDYAELNIKTDVPTVSLPMKKLLAGEYNIKQPDHKIKRILPSCLLLAVIVIAGLILSFYFLGNKYADNRTRFMITEQNGIEYAVIYNSGDNVIVAPCRETENVLVVDSALQKVIPVEGLEYEVRQYADTELGSISCATGEKSSSAGVNNE